MNSLRKLIRDAIKLERENPCIKANLAGIAEAAGYSYRSAAAYYQAMNKPEFDPEADRIDDVYGDIVEYAIKQWERLVGDGSERQETYDPDREEVLLESDVRVGDGYEWEDPFGRFTVDIEVVASDDNDLGWVADGEIVFPERDLEAIHKWGLR